MLKSTAMDEENFQFKCDFCEKSFFNEQILGLRVTFDFLKKIIEFFVKSIRKAATNDIKVMLISFQIDFDICSALSIIWQYLEIS